MNILRISIAAGAIALLSGSAIAGPNCTCRFAGQNYKTGSVMCIRGKLAKCDFVLNNTSWKIIAQTCPQVKGPQLQTPHPKKAVTLTARLRARFAL